MKRFSLRGAQSVVKRKGTEMPPDQIGQHSDTSANSFFHKSKSPFKKECAAAHSRTERDRYHLCLPHISALLSILRSDRKKM
jgi:hypothetical protein